MYRNICMVVIIKKREVVNASEIDFDDNNHINIDNNILLSFIIYIGEYYTGIESLNLKTDRYKGQE